MISGIHHVAIICSNYQRSRAFYTEQLNLEVIAENYQPDRGSWKLDLRLPDHRQIELFYIPGAPVRPSYPEAQGLRHLAFVTESVRAAKQELAEKGVDTEEIRQDPYTGKRFMFFSDPDGLPIELYEA